ncbi:hypothetical protein [Nocardia sp. NPDC019395]|uniref:hypothetical protein n=1 Tax=Nocardia sp. NPDC019395 TaxID=3154686 RepID=UPI0033F9DF83
MTALTAVTAASPVVSTRRRRLATVAALAAGAALILSGCGAGKISQTADQVSAINGNTADIGTIALRDVHIVYPGTTTHTNTAGGQAALALSIINTGETVTDELTSVTTDLGTVKVTPAEGDKLEISPSETVVVSTPSAGAETHNTGETVNTAAGETKPAHIEVTGLTQNLTPGLTYDFSFNFKENGSVLVQVPVDAGLESPRHESDLSKSTTGPAGGH